MAKKSNKPFTLKQNTLRSFSESFKQAKVSDILAGKATIAEVCELHEVSRTSVYKWLHQFSNLEKGTKMVVQQDSEQAKTKALYAQLADLERALGRKQLELDYHAKLIELAGEALKIDLKKTFGQTLSNGLEKTNLEIDQK